MLKVGDRVVFHWGDDVPVNPRRDYGTVLLVGEEMWLVRWDDGQIGTGRLTDSRLRRISAEGKLSER